MFAKIIPLKLEIDMCLINIPNHSFFDCAIYIIRVSCCKVTDFYTIT